MVEPNVNKKWAVFLIRPVPAVIVAAAPVHELDASAVVASSPALAVLSFADGQAGPAPDSLSFLSQAGVVFERSYARVALADPRVVDDTLAIVTVTAAAPDDLFVVTVFPAVDLVVTQVLPGNTVAIPAPPTARVRTGTTILILL